MPKFMSDDFINSCTLSAEKGMNDSLVIFIMIIVVDAILVYLWFKYLDNISKRDD